MRLSGPEDCQRRFAILDGWFGPPPIWYGMGRAIELIDGRIRAREYKTEIPRGVAVTTSREAVRVLCAAGEYQRARSYVPETMPLKQVAAWATIPPEWVIAMGIRPHHKVLPLSVRAREVVHRLRTLLESEGPYTSEDLRWALGRFAPTGRPLGRPRKTNA